MHRTIVPLFSALVAVACAKEPAPALPPSAPAPAPAPAATSEAAPAAAPPKDDAAAKREQELAKMREELEKDAAESSARWTPALRDKVSALMDREWKTTKAALTTILASEHRRPGNATRDVYRHPSEMLVFFGIKPNSRVFELAQGQGWWTELLAPLLAKHGKLSLIGANPDAKGTEGELRNRSVELFKSSAGNLYDKVEMVPQAGEAMVLGEPGSLDVVLVFRMFHNYHRAKRYDKVLPAIHAALKDRGVLAVEQHRAAEGADPDATAEKGYMPQKWLVEKIESYGFKLEKSSEMNANPKDTKDHPEGVWTLPPTLALGDKDRAKYEAIGESDRMTLKFVKTSAKEPVKAK